MLSLIAVVYNACAYSQTNLICNPSFEDVDQDALERLNNADFFHPTHFYLWSDNYPNYPSVLGCWERDNDHAIVGTPDEIERGLLFLLFSRNSNMPCKRMSSTLSAWIFAK
jgi:hypothetical protein